MKKLLVIVLFFPLIALGQPGRFVAKGLLSGKGTLALGLPTAYKGNNMYVSCNIEYYPENNVSVRGGLYIFLAGQGDTYVFQQNSTLFTGLYYHIKTNNHLDPYVGIEPGLSLTRLKVPANISELPISYSKSAYPFEVSPVAGLAVGINYYATNWAHIFIEGKYVYGTHLSDLPAVSLSEFKLAFGFGFNMWAIKQKKTVVAANTHL